MLHDGWIVHLFITIESDAPENVDSYYNTDHRITDHSF